MSIRIFPAKEIATDEWLVHFLPKLDAFRVEKRALSLACAPYLHLAPISKGLQCADRNFATAYWYMIRGEIQNAELLLEWANRCLHELKESLNGF